MIQCAGRGWTACKAGSHLDAGNSNICEHWFFWHMWGYLLILSSHHTMTWSKREDYGTLRKFPAVLGFLSYVKSVKWLLTLGTFLTSQEMIGKWIMSYIVHIKWGFWVCEKPNAQMWWKKFCFWFSSDLINFVVYLFLCTVFYSNSWEWEGYKYIKETAKNWQNCVNIYRIMQFDSKSL